MGIKPRLTMGLALLFPLFVAGAQSASAATRAPLFRPPVIQIRQSHGSAVPAQGFTNPFATSGVTAFAGLGPCDPALGGFFCYTPGEPVVAVGPSDVVETANAAAAVYSKTTGAKLSLPRGWNHHDRKRERCGQDLQDAGAAHHIGHIHRPDDESDCHDQRQQLRHRDCRHARRLQCDRR